VRTLAFGLLAAVLSAPSSAPAQVRYGGSSTIAETILKRGVLESFTARGGVPVQIVDESGTGRGLEALLAGKIDVAGAGRPLTSAERRSGLVGTVIALDAVTVYVHRTNPVKDLTREQLRDVLSGKVGSWKAVGGRDVPIVPMVEPPGSQRATFALLRELVLGAAPIAPGARAIELIRDQLAEVARTEGGICLASVGYLATVEPEVRDGVRAVTVDGTPPTDANIRGGTYLLSRPMLLVTRGAPGGAVKTFVDYVLSREGQAFVERYFVPIATR
jgi:phosphate transport system substrate-binding protein